MILKSALQRLWSYKQPRQIAIVATATVVLGLTIYKQSKRQKQADPEPPTDDTPHDKIEGVTSDAGTPPSTTPPTATAKLPADAYEDSYFATKQDPSGNSTNVKWDSNWDTRDPESLVKPPKTEDDRATFLERVKKKTPSATRHLFLIRHGNFNAFAADDVQQVLTYLGQEQAEMTGGYLCNVDLPYTRMVTSTLTRAVETADIIHRHLPALALDRDDLLCEGRPVLPEPLLHWRPDHKYFQEGARIEAAFRKYFHRADPMQKDDSFEIIVCHANVIRYCVCRALQFPPEGWFRLMLPHGSITHVMICPSGNVYLQGLGDVGHMDPKKVTVASGTAQKHE